MIEKLDIPKFESEAEEAEWWDRHREDTAKWLEEAVAAGQTTTLSAVLKHARERSGLTVAGASTPAVVPEFAALAREARQHFEKAEQLLHRRDCAGYGAEMKKLQDVLQRLAPR